MGLFFSTMAVMKKKVSTTSTNKIRIEARDSLVEGNNEGRKLVADLDSSASGYECFADDYDDDYDYDDDDDAFSSLPSLTEYYLFLHKDNLIQSNSVVDNAKACNQEEEDEFILLPFEDKEYEISYRALRQREKKLILHDPIFEYSKSLPVYGGLVLQQRRVMVDWMMRASKVHSLHYETLFLGVSLLDRFLAKGYLKTKSSMQVLGIACLKLAAKIEENRCSAAIIEDPFFVGGNEYCYQEVIAMEWIVQEVLEFHCIVPTVYNFLDYYLKAAKADVEIQSKAKQMATQSLTGHRRLGFSPSTVAAALVIIASISMDRESACEGIIKTHLSSSNDQLQFCIQSLEVRLDRLSHLDVLFVETESCVLLSSLMKSIVR